MALLGILGLVTAMRHQTATPVLWMDARGGIQVEGKAVMPRVTPGVNRFRTQLGTTYGFSGQRGGMLFGDLPPLRLTESLTVSTWIYPRSYVNDGPGAQILFRGDDRSGVDPYSLVVEGDGTINFQIQNERDQGMKVKAELPLNRWSHVLASFNGQTGDLILWVNAERVAFSRTSRRPFAKLDPAYAPGVSIGNVQNDHGPHNQPFNGMLSDLRLYASVQTPEDIGITPGMPIIQAIPMARLTSRRFDKN